MVIGVSTTLGCEVCNVECDGVMVTVALVVILTVDADCKEWETVSGGVHIILLLPPNGGLYNCCWNGNCMWDAKFGGIICACCGSWNNEGLKGTLLWYCPTVSLWPITKNYKQYM